MASFGFSIGDVALLSTYAYKVYKSSQNAGEFFATITADVSSLRSLLVTLDNETSDPKSSLRHLSHAQQGELAARLEECKTDLSEVKKVLHQFRSLDSKDPLYRDRLAFTNGKQAALRDRLSTHSARIQQFLAGINVATFSRIERNTEAHLLSLSDIRARLDEIYRDMRAGRRGNYDPESFADVESLREEVFGDDMTDAGVDLSHEIADWLKTISDERDASDWEPPDAFPATQAGGTGTATPVGAEKGEEDESDSGSNASSAYDLEDGGTSNDDTTDIANSGTSLQHRPYLSRRSGVKHLTVSFSAAPPMSITNPYCVQYDHRVDLRSKQARSRTVVGSVRCRTYDVSSNSWKLWEFGDYRSLRVKACLVKLDIPKKQYYAASSQCIAITRKNTDDLDGVPSEGVFLLTIDLPNISSRKSSRREDIMYVAVGNERGTRSYFEWVNTRHAREALTGSCRDNILIRFCPVE